MSDNQFFYRPWDSLKPKLGDIIEFLRVGYGHLAIWVGGGYVIHVEKTGKVHKITVKIQTYVVSFQFQFKKSFIVHS